MSAWPVQFRALLHWGKGHTYNREAGGTAQPVYARENVNVLRMTAPNRDAQRRTQMGSRHLRCRTNEQLAYAL